jgi:MFS family permease
VRSPAILAPLRHRSFLLLFLGGVISDLGDWLNLLALLILVAFRWNLGVGALAAIAIARAVPFVVLAPVAGVWVDRLPRKPVMIACDLARAVVVLGLVWAPNIVTLVLIVIVAECFSVFFGPARQATIREVVPDESLLAANSLTSLSVQLTKVIGPAIGGLLVAIGGPRAAFYVDSATFLASAAFISQLFGLAAPRSEEEAPTTRFWQEFTTGLSFIYHRRVLAVAVSSVTAALFLIFTFDALGALALKDLGLDQSLVGLAVGSVGLGTAAGAVIIGQTGTRFDPLAMIGIGAAGAGVLVAVVGGGIMGHVTGLGIAWLPVWLGLGLAGAALFIPYSYVLQHETPQELLGRVSATANGLQTTFQILAPLIGAVLAAQLGIGFVYVVAGIGLAILGAAVLRFGLERRIDAETGAETGSGSVVEEAEVRGYSEEPRSSER